MKDIRTRLNKELLFLDGGLGTMLQKHGMGPGEIPELWGMKHHDVLDFIHSAYLESGSHIITANTFGINRFKLQGTGLSVDEVVFDSVSRVRQAIAKGGYDAYTALDVGPTGKLLKPLGDLDFEEAVSVFAEVVSAGEKAGADLILIETMSDTYELKGAVLAAKEHTNLPVFASVTLDKNGKMLTGGDIGAVVALLEGLRVDAIGINCAQGPRQILPMVEEMSRYSSTPLMVQPNAGLPSVRDGKTCFDVDEDEFARIMTQMPALGAAVLGGCCGTTPTYIKKLIAACKDVTLQPVTPKEFSVVSSYTHAVYLGKDPLMAGECINPNGAAAFKQAIQDRDLEYIMRGALKQQAAGASTIDVNVGLPGIEEPKMLCDVVKAVQSVCDVPLQLDTSNVQALEQATRIYNGKPIINSVNGKADSMKAVFSIMQKYGGMAIALTLDETGIPKTAQGRLEIAKKIIHTAAEYGIAKKDLIIDPLTMTISTGSDNANVTLETLRLVKEQLHVPTVLGVSNISFGLPNRAAVTQAFMTMALSHGLSLAIINPLVEEMQKAFFASRALIGADANCSDYIARYKGMSAVQRPQDAELTLHEAVLQGMKEQAATAVAKELTEKEPVEVIDQVLVPALNEVGQAFEEQTMYLPQLLMSAEAAQSAFDVIKEHMGRKGQKQQKKGRIILATVKGDIHDIGKNIVKALLQNYGYDVIDLGKDVDPELVLTTAIEQNVPLVGLSALMTTTVISMQDTIALLKQNRKDIRVMVGGAVLTEQYAREIGADYYGKDAMGSVRYAREVFGS